MDYVRGYSNSEIKGFIEQLNKSELVHKEFEDAFLFAKASDIIMQLLKKLETLEDSRSFRNNY